MADSHEEEWRPVPAEILNLIRGQEVADLIALMGDEYRSWGSSRSEEEFHTQFGRRGRDAPLAVSSNTQEIGCPKHSLELFRTRKGVIASAEISPDQGVSYEEACRELESLVRRCVAVLREPQREQTATKIVFSHIRASGEFCFPSHFCIREAPQAAPLPKTIFGNYPVMVTFSFQSPSNEWLRQRREQQALEDLVLILNVLLRPGLWLPRRQSGHHWVLDREGDKPQTKYLQSGYHVPFDAREYPIGRTNLPEIPTRPDEKYYGVLGLSPLDGLVVPQGLAELYQTYLDLDAESRDAFLAAARHFQNARD